MARIRNPPKLLGAAAVRPGTTLLSSLDFDGIKKLPHGEGAVEALVLSVHVKPWGPPRWRGGYADQRYDMAREHYRVPVLAHMRALSNFRPCESCARGNGPFTDCRTLDGYANGTCTNCAWGSLDIVCSLRLADQEVPSTGPAARGDMASGGSADDTTARDPGHVETSTAPQGGEYIPDGHAVADAAAQGQAGVGSGDGDVVDGRPSTPQRTVPLSPPPPYPDSPYSPIWPQY